MSFVVEIVTPEKIIYKENADELIVPTVTGQLSVLTNHARLLTQVMPGELVVTKGNERFTIVITEGFMEIDDNYVSILANFAIRADDIEVAKVEEARKRAENIMKEKATDKDFKIAEAELQKSLLQLRVAGKYKRKSLRI